MTNFLLVLIVQFYFNCVLIIFIMHFVSFDCEKLTKYDCSFLKTMSHSLQVDILCGKSHTPVRTVTL